MCQEFCPEVGCGIPACIAHSIPACLAGIQGVVSQHALQVSRPTPKGEVEGSGLGGLQAHTQGGLQAHTQGVSQHALRQTPPSRRLLLRAVCMLLECILVYNIISNQILVSKLLHSECEDISSRSNILSLVYFA